MVLLNQRNAKLTEPRTKRHGALTWSGLVGGLRTGQRHGLLHDLGVVVGTVAERTRVVAATRLGVVAVVTDLSVRNGLIAEVHVEAAALAGLVRMGHTDISSRRIPNG